MIGTHHSRHERNHYRNRTAFRLASLAQFAIEQFPETKHSQPTSILAPHKASHDHHRCESCGPQSLTPPSVAPPTPSPHRTPAPPPVRETPPHPPFAARSP